MNIYGKNNERHNRELGININTNNKEEMEVLNLNQGTVTPLNKLNVDSIFNILLS